MGYRGGSIVSLGTQRHHDKWLRITEELKVFGCFAMTELGHGSNVSCMHTGLLLFSGDTGLGCIVAMRVIHPGAEYLLCRS